MTSIFGTKDERVGGFLGSHRELRVSNVLLGTLAALGARAPGDGALAHVPLRTRARTGMDGQRRPRGPPIRGICVRGRRSPARGGIRPRGRRPATRAGRGRASARASCWSSRSASHWSRDRSSRGTSSRCRRSRSGRAPRHLPWRRGEVRDRRRRRALAVVVQPVGVGPHLGGPARDRRERRGARAARASCTGDDSAEAVATAVS